MKLIDLEEPYKVEIELNGHKSSISVIGKLVDAVPVVRCKDCRYFHKFTDWADCDFHEWYRAEPNENDFCSKGERK